MEIAGSGHAGYHCATFCLDLSSLYTDTFEEGAERWYHEDYLPHRANLSSVLLSAEGQDLLKAINSV